MEPELVSGIAAIDLDESGGNKHEEIFYGQAYLSGEQKKTMFEILRCAVCLELPRLTAHNQVFICENGHHFCQSCHVRLNSCAVCRGALGVGRNFVVEELLTKLGKQLGIIHPPFHKALAPPALPKGRSICPHNCNARMAGHEMLTHIRQGHPDCINDKLRTNPHSGWFEASFQVNVQLGTKNAKSYQISDMGLFSVVVFIPKEYNYGQHGLGEITGYVQMLQINRGFEYNLSITHGSKQCVRINMPVCSFLNPTPCSFDIRDAKVGETIVVNFLIRRNESLRPISLSWPNTATEVATFATDRPSRRTLKRNQRRKIVRRKLRQIIINNLLEGVVEQESAKPSSTTVVF